MNPPNTHPSIRSQLSPMGLNHLHMGCGLVMAPHPRELSSPVLTPQHVPPLKKPPISLPGTLNGHVLQSSYETKSSNNLFGWPSIQSNSVPEILSPLGLSAKSSFVSLPIDFSPTFPLNLPQRSRVTEDYGTTQFISAPAYSHRATMATPIRNGKRKGKDKAPAVDTEELKARASAFSRTSAVVRDASKRWAAKTSEQFLCNDAVRHSDAYVGQKTKRRHGTGSQVN